MAKRPKRVREPIQVYLTGAERATLDRLAREMGVSRAEVLRRGLLAVARSDSHSLYDAFDRLIGIVDDRATPTDLAERHDEHLALDREARMARFRRRSS